MIYRVRNWSDHQHYKDRNPPWIKLHYALLSSRDWVMWDDASRALAIAIMLLASRSGGEIDLSAEGLDYLSRVAYLHGPPNVQPLVATGFLEPASTMLADASTMQADARPEERKRREETEVPAELFQLARAGETMYAVEKAYHLAIAAGIDPDGLLRSRRAACQGERRYWKSLAGWLEEVAKGGLPPEPELSFEEAKRLRELELREQRRQYEREERARIAEATA